MQPTQLPPRGVGTDPPARRIAVLVVDDHPAVRAGVTGLLAGEPDMVVVGQAATAAQAIETARGVDVAVIDYHLGDRNGLWVTGELCRVDPAPRVLIYSAFSDEVLAILVLIAGADGLLSKAAIGDELCLAVRRLAGGGRYLPRLSMPVVGAMRAQLPDRLRAAFDMLVQGISPDHICEALRLFPPELDVARRDILDALAPAITRDRRATPSRSALNYDRPLGGSFASTGPRPRTGSRRASRPGPAGRRGRSWATRTLRSRRRADG